MDLQFDIRLADGYRSKSQIIRILSESWVAAHAYCPLCAAQPLHSFNNNKPVADFYCHHCGEEYELKSKQAKLSNVIADGAYQSMMARIKSDNNPNFFFLTYSKQLSVNDLLIIPKHFFTPSIIIKRKPLADTARRAGWVGCNIDLRHVPDSGKIFLVKDQKPVEQKLVTSQFGKTLFMREQSQQTRGWLIDVLQCVDKLPEFFSLSQAYQFADVLQQQHPENNHIHAKIRQQLQLLRDKGVLEFVGRGRYRKI